MNDDKPTPPEPENSTTTAAKPAGEQDKQDKKPAESDLDVRKPEELTPEDLRLMADTMPGEGPGDD